MYHDHPKVTGMCGICGEQTREGESLYPHDVLCPNCYAQHFWNQRLLSLGRKAVLSREQRLRRQSKRD